jgi:hypothetical protein
MLALMMPLDPERQARARAAHRIHTSGGARSRVWASAAAPAIAIRPTPASSEPALLDAYDRVGCISQRERRLADF